MSEIAIAPVDRTNFVELSRTKTGRLFKKEILKKGELINPNTGERTPMDDDFFTALTTNFHNKVCDIVQVPIAGPNNEHSEDPDRNIGEVVDLKLEGDSYYAYIDARDEERADKLGKTLIGASAMYHPNYKDTRTGEYVGPTMLHVAVTNRPYVLDLSDYEEVVAASAEGDGEAVLLTAAPAAEAPTIEKEEAIVPTKEELLAQLKADHGYDAEALVLSAQQERDAAVTQATTAMSQITQLTNSLGGLAASTGVIKLSNGEDFKPETVIGAVGELVKQNGALREDFTKLSNTYANDKATTEVDDLIGQGRILPAQREVMIELCQENRERFDRLVPAEPIVPLSNPSEVEDLRPAPQDAVALSGLNIDDEVKRLVDQMNNV